jgi:hypothetical protein
MMLDPTGAPTSSNRAGTLVADQFGGLSTTAWTHRFKAGGAVEFSLYDQIWTSRDLPVSVAEVVGGRPSWHTCGGIDRPVRQRVHTVVAQEGDGGVE